MNVALAQKNQESLGITKKDSSPFLEAKKHFERPIQGTDFHFKILTDIQDIENAYELRYEIFCNEMNVIDPKKCVAGKEFDSYDPFCLHTAIVEHGRIIAYTRLILPCREFPIEKTNFLPKIFERNRTVEVSRAILVKDRRGPENIFWHLSNSLYELCQEDEIETLLSFSNTVMYNGYKKRGVDFRYVGEPVLFHGHKSHPLIINVHKHKKPNFLLK
jgi:N-acyl-L-homoserine lactone synthetase